VGELAEAVGWSRRRLLTRFTAQVGLGPKAAARVLRFRHAAGLLTAPGARTIAEVAAAAGYADHSHLVREFRALAGCPPSGFTPDTAGPYVQDGMGGPALPWPP
jgi:transcriptional regulator GlxA family with amidase domain